MNYSLSSRYIYRRHVEKDQQASADIVFLTFDNQIFMDCLIVTAYYITSSNFSYSVESEHDFGRGSQSTSTAFMPKCSQFLGFLICSITFDLQDHFSIQNQIQILCDFRKINNVPFNLGETICRILYFLVKRTRCEGVLQDK